MFLDISTCCSVKKHLFLKLNQITITFQQISLITTYQYQQIKKICLLVE